MSPDPDLLAVIPWEGPGAYLPLAEYTPLIRRIAELELLLRASEDLRAQIARLAGVVVSGDPAA